MEKVEHFFRQWLQLLTINEETIHNLALALVCARLIYIFVKWFRTLLNEREQDSFRLSKKIKRLILVLLTNFLLGSLFLCLAEGKQLKNWYFSGWRFDDILLTVVFCLIVLSLFFFIRFQLKKKTGFLIFLKKTSGFLVGIFLLFGSVLFLCHNVFISKDLDLESPLIVVKEGSSEISVVKVRRVTPNGTENGISTSTSSFLLSGVELSSGKSKWRRPSSWQEYLVGETPAGILTLNAKKEELYFLDPFTGEKGKNEQDLVKEFPDLKENLSYSTSDYAIGSNQEIYFHGLDNFYYKLDLKNKKLEKNETYQQAVNENFFKKTITSRETAELAGKLDKMYPELIDVKVVPEMIANNQAGVLYKQKRNDKQGTLALVSSEKHEIIWQKKLDRIPDFSLDSFGFYVEERFVYVVTGLYQYKIARENGRLVYRYDYLSNELVQ